MCGEKWMALRLALARAGSPPRVRGKDASTGLADIVVGITPACAGKSASSAVTSTSARDHPRVCGEKIGWRAKVASSIGSPPRVRGKAVYSAPHVCDVRITPACAGKSYKAKCERAGMRDHPRVCGEKLRVIVFVLSGLGSPPRVRGKARAREIQRHGRGITPACAGKRDA